MKFKKKPRETDDRQLGSWIVSLISIVRSWDDQAYCSDHSQTQRLCPKVDPIWSEPVSTGSAGAIARRSVRSTLNLKTS